MNIRPIGQLNFQSGMLILDLLIMTPPKKILICYYCSLTCLGGPESGTRLLVNGQLVTCSGGLVVYHECEDHSMLALCSVKTRTEF